MFEKITQPYVNLTDRGVSRTLLQFRNSANFLNLIAAISEEVQELFDAIKEIIELRSPALARGENLNTLGRIVGQLRTLVDFDTITWFTPDTINKSVDQAPIWCQNAPIAGTYNADDGWYRQLIEAKVFRNFVKYGSVPEIQEYVKKAFGVDISIIRTDIMTIQLVVSDNASGNIIEALQKYTDTDRAEHIYWLPLAAGVAIGSVIRFSDYSDSSS